MTNLFYCWKSGTVLISASFDNRVIFFCCFLFQEIGQESQKSMDPLLESLVSNLFSQLALVYCLIDFETFFSIVFIVSLNYLVMLRHLPTCSTSFQGFIWEIDWKWIRWKLQELGQEMFYKHGIWELQCRFSTWSEDNQIYFFFSSWNDTDRQFFYGVTFLKVKKFKNFVDDLPLHLKPHTGGTGGTSVFFYAHFLTPQFCSDCLVG